MRKTLTTKDTDETWSVLRVRNGRRILRELAKDDAKLIKVASDALRLCAELPLKLVDEAGADYLCGLANLLGQVRVGKKR